MVTDLTVHLRRPHARQAEFIDSAARRRVIRAGRRAGKTTGAATLAVRNLLAGHRILYATPTQEQIDTFWEECKRALFALIDSGLIYKNETRHILEMKGGARIRAKTAWDADSLRGDYADVLILDEYQLMKPNAWNRVGAPMLLDNDGIAVFIYTSMRGARHARDLYKKAQADMTGRWAVFNFPSHENPHLNEDALADITGDMTNLAYRMEILAEDIEDSPGALWKRTDIEEHRVMRLPELSRIVVGVDPSATSGGDECGIIVAGMAQNGGKPHLYVLDDISLQGSPADWAKAVVAAYHKWRADCIIAESNNGGEMVSLTIRTVPDGGEVPIKLIHASRGKQARAEPVSSIYWQGRGHHVGTFSLLEDEQCQWEVGGPSPNRLDALVWAATELVLGGTRKYLY